MPPFPTHLYTRRLTLRPRTLADAPAMYARYASDPEVTHFMSWPTHASVEDAEKHLRDDTPARERRSDRPRHCVARPRHWAVRVRGERDLCGTISVFPVLDAGNDGGAYELGYVLARDVWGNGYATEAALAVIAAAWRIGSVTRIVAQAHVDNAASRRVLVKCGMRENGEADSRLPLLQLPTGVHRVAWYKLDRPTCPSNASFERA